MAAEDINQKSQELAKSLWAIACDLRGSMDSSKFKNYILGIIFYRYLSERTEGYMDDLLAQDGITYIEALKSPEYVDVVKGWAIDHLGYVIEPQYLFKSMVDEIKENTFSISHLEKAIQKLTESTLGQDSEAAFDKLFDDMNLQDKDLGKEVSERTALIGKVMLKVGDIPFDFKNAKFDVLGTAYMQLIALFASDAGKKGGEFFSPMCASELLAKLVTVGLESAHSVCDCAAGSGSLLLASDAGKKGGEFFSPMCASELLAKLVTVGLESAHSVCDCAAGSGSLLLEVQKELSTHNVSHFYAQEKNGVTYNLLRMNLLMHGVPYRSFTTYNDDTLAHDNFKNVSEGFQLQVANPPYSLKFDFSKSFENDPRFASCALPPKSYADLGFVEHMVYHMSNDGRIAVLLPHGVLFRSGAEKKIREYLIGTLNVVDAIIGLPANLFHGTSIPTIVMILKKNRNGDSDNIFFMDASKYFKKGKNMNELEEKDIERIVDAYTNRVNIDKFAYKAPLSEVKEDNDYNCNIPRYVDTFEEEAPIDLNEVRSKIKDAKEQKQNTLDVVNQMLRELGLEEM